VSEQAPERTGGGGGGNVFTRKIGPLPMWAWMAIALLVALGYYLIKKKSSGNSTANDQTGSGTDTAGAGGVDSSLVPQFVNQTYVNNSPPAAPAATSTGTQQPGYGKAGPPNANYQAITNTEASLLESNSNVANPSGEKAQRPFIWNGSAYVPNTNPITAGNQYYAGPLETQELNTAIKKGTITSTGTIPAKKPATKTPAKK
jgi:hypothetical protein